LIDIHLNAALPWVDHFKSENKDLTFLLQGLYGHVFERLRESVNLQETT